jgi:hypothetical protein
MSRTFADLDLAKRPRQGVCKRCRAAISPEGENPSINLLISARKIRKGGGYSSTLASRSTTLCESCAVDVFEAGTAAIEAEMDASTRNEERP